MSLNLGFIRAAVRLVARAATVQFVLLHTLPVDVLGKHFRIVPAMQGIVTLIPPTNSHVMHQVLRIPRNSLRK